MKHHRFFRLLCAATILLIMLCSLAGCGDQSDAVITAPDEPTTTAPTQPVPLGPMTLEDLTRIMSPAMTWSEIMMYDHTAVDDTHATFEVSDQSGNKCTLAVTYDAIADIVTVADLSYGELTYSVLTDSTAPIRDIMVAIRQATETAE